MTTNCARVYSLKLHRGSPRLYLEGAPPARSGFLPGYRFQALPHGNGVVLKVDPAGERLVSRKEVSGSVVPVLDINSVEALKPLLGQSVVRVVFGDGVLYISPIASEMRRVRRLSRLQTKLQTGQPLATAGICAGGGVLSHALHAGLADAQVDSELAIHNEIRADLSEHAEAHNELVTEKTVLLNMPLQELAFDAELLRRIEEVDIAEFGLPCSGASVAGRAKRGLDLPEHHPEVGHLVVGALALLAVLNPAVVVFENVKQYANTASAALIRNQLRDLGYDCHERELYGPDFGDLEARTRWFMVAVTRGIDFDFESLRAADQPARTLADIMEPPEVVADRWSEMTGLKAKQERDKASGAGFMMQVYTGAETTVNTLTKGIAKNRSTDPKFQHPEYPELLRIPTAAEHARCKGVPEHLIVGLSQTTAHELLGQGVCYRPVRALGGLIGATLRRWAAANSAEKWRNAVPANDLFACAA